MYTKITRAVHGASAIAYVLKEKGHYKDKRNDLLGYINLNPYSDITKQMQRYWKKASDRHTIQIRRVIISFSEKECDKNDELRKQQLMDMVKDGLKEMYPDRQILLALQSDGKAGKVHIHALINDVSMTDYKGIKSNENNFFYLKEHLNAHMEKSGLILDYGKKRQKGSKSDYQKYLEDNGKYSWRKDLEMRVSGALDAADSYDGFMKELELRGVRYNDSAKRKYNSYTLEDYSLLDKYKMPHPKKKMTARGDKLGERFGKEALKTHFARKELNDNSMSLIMMPDTADDNEIENEISKSLNSVFDTDDFNIWCDENNIVISDNTSCDRIIFIKNMYEESKAKKSLDSIQSDVKTDDLATPVESNENKAMKNITEEIWMKRRRTKHEQGYIRADVNNDEATDNKDFSCKAGTVLEL
ncbi:MAG: hypothetical protein E7302_08000 [Butyrivibrio sp.]|nr:hypothetical protein [Butyrivibrio sp.]